VQSRGPAHAPMLAPAPSFVLPPGTTESLAPYFESGQPFEGFLPTAEKYPEFWEQVWLRAQVPEAFVARVEALPGRWHLLVLSADWCGDAVNIVPVLARLAERAENLDLRVLERDTFPELRDAHLTNGRSQSIPVVIALDEGYRERGWWGPRPSPLQQWVREEGLALDPGERYRLIRRWYAQDRGVTSLEEVVTLLESAAPRD
jgi:hypothetical protein